MLSLLVPLLLFVSCYQDIQGVILSDTPQSRNVSAGTSVEFTCATPETGLALFTIKTDVTLGNTTNNDVILPSGERQLTLGFIAPSEYQLINIACIAHIFNALNALVTNSSTAILMIQGLLSGVGNLTSSEVDHCTLHFTWTAPYTLQGVPIKYYTINITRHSDGAVLRSDTTNTTEYLYTVSSLGETLEVVVAAVNGAGTGNVSSIITQAGISSFEFAIDERSRLGDEWTFKSTIELRTICDDYKKFTVHLYDESSGETYNTTANITTLPDGRRRLVAHFPNIPEDTQYHATSKVHYTERSTQHSNQVNTNTFDIDFVNYTITDGVVCITVEFVEGAESHSFSVKVMCKSENIFKSFNGSNGVMNNMPQNEVCTLFITDADATNSMNARPAFLTNIQVPGTTEEPPTTSVNINKSPTPITRDNNQQNIAIVVAVAVAVAILLIIIISLGVFAVLKMKTKIMDNLPQRKKCGPHVQVQTKVAGSEPSAGVVEVPLPDTASSMHTSELFQNDSNSNEQSQMHAHHIDVSSPHKLSSFWTSRSIKMNNGQSQPTYEQPTCDQPTQSQYADVATCGQGELIPQQPPTS